MKRGLVKRMGERVFGQERGGQYYFIKERNAMGGQCERYKGTFFSGGLVGGEDGRYYMADYFCNRPKVYEPEDGSTYTFNYHTWEFVKAS